MVDRKSMNENIVEVNHSNFDIYRDDLWDLLLENETTLGFWKSR